jgi:hypothetical protein
MKTSHLKIKESHDTPMHHHVIYLPNRQAHQFEFSFIVNFSIKIILVNEGKTLSLRAWALGLAEF